MLIEHYPGNPGGKMQKKIKNLPLRFKPLYSSLMLYRSAKSALTKAVSSCLNFHVMVASVIDIA